MTAELKTAVGDRGRLFLSAAWMNHFLFQGFMADYEENRLSVDDFLAPLGGFSQELITMLRLNRMERRSCAFLKTEWSFSIKVNKQSSAATVPSSDCVTYSINSDIIIVWSDSLLLHHPERTLCSVCEKCSRASLLPGVVTDTETEQRHLHFKWLATFVQNSQPEQEVLGCEHALKLCNSASSPYVSVSVGKRRWSLRLIEESVLINQWTLCSPGWKLILFN